MIGAPISSSWVLVLGCTLFSIGAAGLIVRRNAIIMLMCIELMLNSANVIMVGYSQIHHNLSAHVVVLFIMLVAAVEVAVGLALLALIFRNRQTANIDEVSHLKW